MSVLTKADLEEILAMLDDAPEYHHSGMGCGLEVRNIHNRYEAMQHGWDSVIERVYWDHVNPAIEALKVAIEKASTPAPQDHVELTITRALGVYGAAYDPPGPHRAYTYQHQPANQAAYRLGCAVAALRENRGGDTIDVGLYLLKELEARGFGVFEVQPRAALKSKGSADE